MKYIIVYVCCIIGLYIIGTEHRQVVEKELKNEQMHVL